MMGCMLLFASCQMPDNSGLQIFRYNESAGVTTLDPAFAKNQAIMWPCEQLYNGLVRLDTNLQPEPCIARSWEISPDGLCYTFHLRTDVRFHPPASRTVVADDFVYSLGRVADKQSTSPGAWIFSDVDTIRAQDDSTLVVRLQHASPAFLAQMGMVYCSVVPHEVVEQWGADFRAHPCGTGPFMFQYWKEGVKLVLRRNPDYFEHDSAGHSIPYLDAVAVTFIADRQTAFLEFVKGNLDFMNSLDPTYKDELLTPTGELKEKYNGRIVMTSSSFLNTEYLGFLCDDASSPFRDRKLRQAVSCGFDREKMMRYLRNNIGQPGTAGFVPPTLLQGGSDAVPTYGYHYDPDRARKLLAEAGYPGGKGLPTLKLSTTANYLDLCKYLQQQLGLLGMDVQVDVSQPAALRGAIGKGTTQWFRGSWIADYPDAENYLMLFYSKNHAPQGPNYTRFTNAHFDKLYNRALRQNDAQSRATIYRQMDSLIMEEAPVMVLYYDQILHFTHPNVEGLRTDAMNNLDLRFVRLK